MMTDAAYAMQPDELDEDVEGFGPEEADETAVDVDWLTTAVDSPNLAYELEDSQLAQIGAKVCDEYEIDRQSLEDEGWFDMYESAMKLAMQVKEAKSYPFEGASSIKYPLLTTAAIQFAARAYGAIVPGFNVVKGKVLGKPDDTKQDRADRIGRHMSYQLLEEMKGWEEDTDRLLHMLPIAGCVFRKTYFDPLTGHNCSYLVPPDKLICNYWTRDIESCPRMTHVCEYYPNEIEERFRTGLWKRVDLGLPDSEQDDDDAARTFLEQHRLLDLDDDGLPEPYIVTVHEESRQVVRIYARFDEAGVKLGTNPETGQPVVTQIEPLRYFTKYSFIPSVNGAFYDQGFGSLLAALNETINSTLNQIMDAGHLANVQGGFIGSGVSMKSGALRMKPGQWVKVESTGGALKDNIMPMNLPGPNPVLFSLLQFLIAAAQDVTSTKDVLTGDTTPQNQPVGTTMALIEQGLKVYNAIFKRIFRAFKWELSILYRLNGKYLDPEVYVTFQDEDIRISKDDYDGESVDVIPVADPTVVMDSQRMARAQFLQQFMPLPFMNQMEIVKRSLDAGQIPDTKALFIKPQPNPQAMIEGEKVKTDQMKAVADLARSKAESQRADADTKQTLAETVKTITETALLMEQGGIDPADIGFIRGMEERPSNQGVPAIPPGLPGGDPGQMAQGQPEPAGGPPVPEAGPDAMGAGDLGMGEPGPVLQPGPGA